MNKALLQQALDALECLYSGTNNNEWDGKAIEEFKAAIQALKAELAKPEPEPVGYVYWAKGHAEGALDNQTLKPGTPLYAAPTEPNCRFPVCHSQEYQEKLADEITKEQL